MVPGDGTALFGMPDTEVLGMLKITCEVINSKQTGRSLTLKLWGQQVS